MTVQAHGATIDITADSVVISRSLLSVCLGGRPQDVVPLSSITGVSATQPGSATAGSLLLEGPGVTVAFAPNQDAEACAALIRSAQRGEAPSAGPLAAGKVAGLDFTAVDVETANGNWGSICQIGAVRFRDGEETEAATWLCKPPAGIDSFDDLNIGIHGIKPEDVADAPDFATVAAEFKQFLGEDTFVAHNAQFDSTALHLAHLAAGIPSPALSFTCSLALARHASKLGVINVANHKLPTVAAAVGLDKFKHHDACEDARAAGHIISGLARGLEFEGTITGLFESQGFTVGSMNGDVVMPVLRAETAPNTAADLGAGTDFRDPSSTASGRSRKPAAAKAAAKKSGAKNSSRPAPWQSVATPDTIPAPNPDADPSNPFFGQNVTLTGDFDPFDKGLLWSAIAERGGQIGKNVTKKTTILVLGTWATKTSKEKRAEELISKGQSIELMPSERLFELLGLELEPPF